MASLARDWSQAVGWSCEVIEHDQLVARGFVGTDAIGRSSEHAPCAVLLRNRPQDPVDTAIVAKGVTFDAGGISLKPPTNMGKLKGDMAGAAAALCGALAAADAGTDASFGLVLPFAENLPDGRALRPGDVVTFADGQRVHIESTDAEGRMLLSDGLLHARTAWRAKRIVTMGTLTKACIVALGNHFGALYASDDRLAEALIAAGDDAGERLWRMPVGGPYGYSLRHPVADVANASQDGGGSILAATFIQRFAGDVPWAHIDMSSIFFMDREFPWADRGYTGAGARLVAAFLSGPREVERGDG
jgi:leucyl aminopeptidase